MELYPIQYSPWPFFLTTPRPFLLPPAYGVPENYVHWGETPESHLFTAELSGVRKQEIRVEVEDSRYLIIRTEPDEDAAAAAAAAAALPGPGRKRFMRKFRLPEGVDVESISAGYEDGVLTVTVPRLIVRGRPRIQTADMPQGNHDTVARAA